MKPDELDYVAELARVRAGLKVDRERLYVVESRLGPVARREGFGAIREMLLACRQRKDERLIWTVIESLAAGETFFFRDKQAFTRLGQEILPELMRHRGEAPIRVWSAGCSTGQEPYSLALQVEEAREQLPPGRIEILGTDLSERSLHKAQEGLYNQFEIQRGLPIRLLLRHFERHDEMWRVSPRIRAMARWRRVNLNADFRALGRFDVIFCRNVLEGMEPAAAGRTFEQLSLALEPGGYLVLSGEEDAPVAVPDLQPAGHGIYRADPHRVAA
jgi:chemotaxis protein methyltransferase CheR